ncbi:MAG TPA: lysophospholipid acyltransferase family protein [Bacillota bacterium]|jgi:1-acyl-sn-glycerol-3-phosphate acyltransferase|nr:lysophospholipid acyltransferase family protein [Bacillota bacterium]
MFQKLFFLLFVKPFMALFIGLRVYGKHNLPKVHPFIIVANHSSHLDTLSLLSIFSIKDLHRIQPVAAGDYFNRNRFVSFLTHKLFNILTIPRSAINKENHPVKLMKNALEQGNSLIIYPEGTRSLTEEIGRFRPGIAHLIKEIPGIKVIPVFLANMGRSLPKGEYLPIPFFCEIVIGEPLLLQADKTAIIQTLENAVKRLKHSYEEYYREQI